VIHYLENQSIFLMDMNLTRHLDLDDANTQEKRPFSHQVARDPTRTEICAGVVKREQAIIILIGRSKQQMTRGIVDYEFCRQVTHRP